MNTLQQTFIDGEPTSNRPNIMIKMKYLFWVLPMMLSMLACAKQEAKKILDSKDFMSNVPIKGTYQTEFEIKIKDKIVPLLVTWNTYYDTTDNCNKFVKYKIERTGGDQSVIFSNVSGRFDGTCFLKMDESDPKAERNSSVTVGGHIDTYIGIQRNDINAFFIDLYSDGTFKERRFSFD